MKKYDIVIVGAGPAGLSFAKLVSQSGLKICIIEKQNQSDIANPQYDGREIALTHLSKKIMEEAGMWQLMPQDEISLIKDAKVLNSTSPYTLYFDHKISGKDNLGFMVSNHLIRKAAYDAVAALDNVDMIFGVSVDSAKTNALGAEVTLSDKQKIKSHLLIAADSRFSGLRKMMGIETETHDFKRMCIVSRMSHDKQHDKTAYECFFDDMTLAILPLNRKQTSTVLTIDTEGSKSILNKSPKEFADFITRQIDSRFGKMTLTSKLFAYPLVAVYAKTFHAERFALLGDASVGMHPVTAHGFNFGLNGGYTLSRLICDALDVGLDIGSQTLLAKYTRTHRRATRMIYLGTNTLVKLYTRNSKPAQLLRHGLLRLGNRLAPAQKAIVGMLTEAGK